MYETLEDDDTLHIEKHVLSISIKEEKKDIESPENSVIFDKSVAIINPDDGETYQTHSQAVTSSGEDRGIRNVKQREDQLSNEKPLGLADLCMECISNTCLVPPNHGKDACAQMKEVAPCTEVAEGTGTVWIPIHDEAFQYTPSTGYELARPREIQTDMPIEDTSKVLCETEDAVEELCCLETVTNPKSKLVSEPLAITRSVDTVKRANVDNDWQSVTLSINNKTRPEDQISEDAPLDKPSRTVDKPPMSYIALISMAIQTSPERRMLLSEIYQWLTEQFPYFQMKDKSWRNSIRHNLSLNECFIKNGRSDNGKGSYWAIHPANEEDFGRGDFHRRKARRRVRKCDEEVERICAYACGTSPPVSPMTLSAINITSQNGYVPMTSTVLPVEDLIAMFGEDVILSPEEKILRVGTKTKYTPSLSSVSSNITHGQFYDCNNGYVHGGGTTEQCMYPQPEWKTVETNWFADHYSFS